MEGGRRRKQLLGNLKERTRHQNWKEEELDRSAWRSQFGRGCGLSPDQIWLVLCFPLVIIWFKLLNDCCDFQCVRTWYCSYNVYISLETYTSVAVRFSGAVKCPMVYTSASHDRHWATQCDIFKGRHIRSVVYKSLRFTDSSSFLCSFCPIHLWLR